MPRSAAGSVGSEQGGVLGLLGEKHSAPGRPDDAIEPLVVVGLVCEQSTAVSRSVIVTAPLLPTSWVGRGTGQREDRSRSASACREVGAGAGHRQEIGLFEAMIVWV
jgi:hypothetical protein